MSGQDGYTPDPMITCPVPWRTFDGHLTNDCRVRAMIGEGFNSPTCPKCLSMLLNLRQSVGEAVLRELGGNGHA